MGFKITPPAVEPALNKVTQASLEAGDHDGTWLGYSDSNVEIAYVHAPNAGDPRRITFFNQRGGAFSGWTTSNLRCHADYLKRFKTGTVISFTV